MKQLIRSALILGGALSLAAARPHAPPNPLQVVIGNGPFAGTYATKGEQTACVREKVQKIFAASFKNFDAKGARAFNEGAISVNNPDAAGAKHGDLHVAFGEGQNFTVAYDVSAVPVTMTARGKLIDLAGSGKTKGGIQITVTATCADITPM
jgi:hypothetical protein